MSDEEEREGESSERKHSPFDEGSPITVGGGGRKNKEKDRDRSNLTCRFKDEDFPEEGDPDHDRKKFRHKGGKKIKTFKLRSQGVWTDYSWKLPSNGKCEILISCSGNDDDVVINGDKFGIDMNPVTYPNAGNGAHTNPNVDSYITYVGLRDLNTNQLEPLGDFSEDADCAVCTDLVDSSPHCPS